MRRNDFDDEEELYIPDIGESDDGLGLHEQSPRSNVGVALNWSPLEQQMFDLLLLNRFGGYDSELLDEAAKAIINLLDTFEPHEIARISSVALLSLQLKAVEGRSFEEEYAKYVEYIKKHPEDIEELK